MTLVVHPLNLGEVIIDSSFAIWASEPGTPFQAACTSYLILGSDFPIMVDASFRHAGENTASSGVEFLERSPEQKLEAQLANHGLKPEDIGMVINTHLHLDHSGLTDLLPNARIVLQRKELQYAAAPYFPVPFYDRKDVAKYVGPLFDRIEFIEDEKDHEVAPGVTVAWTGGHSPGHQMVYAEVGSGPAIITGDIVYRKEPGYTLQLPSGYFTDLGEVTHALARIKRDAKHVLPMHDPEVYREYPDGIS